MYIYDKIPKERNHARRNLPMKKRTKKTVTAILTAAVCIAAAIGITVGCIYAENRPKTTFDFAQKTGSVTNGASGFLYGFA